MRTMAAPKAPRAGPETPRQPPAERLEGLQRKASSHGDRSDGEEDDPQKKMLQRLGNSAGGPVTAPSAVNAVVSSAGRPLDPGTLAFMEPRFGARFGQVRVHADDRAAESARAVDAQAYTVGTHVVFGSGRYSPQSEKGRRLLAHELAHTVQQSGQSSCPVVRQKARGGAASEGALEREADAAAIAVSRGGPAVPSIAVSPTAPSLQRAPNDPPGGPSAPGGAAAGGKLNIEFDAFIPGALGQALSTFEHPKGLKNQAAFESQLAAVPGTWKEEPGTFGALGTGPWCYETDDRDYGGGSHRVGFKGSIDKAEIGALANKPNGFAHSTSGSTHVRWKHTGTFTPTDETGSLEGPIKKSAPVTSSETHADKAAGQSTVTTSGACSYPFAKLSPDIDYTLTFDLRKADAGKTGVKFNVKNNKFPAYELLINGGSVWKYVPTDTDPGNVNLRSSDTFQSGEWLF